MFISTAHRASDLFVYITCHNAAKLTVTRNHNRTDRCGGRTVQLPFAFTEYEESLNTRPALSPSLLVYFVCTGRHYGTLTKHDGGIKVNCNEHTLKQSHYTPWRRFVGEEIQLLLILDLGTRWGWVVSVTPRPCFTSWKEPPVPIGQETGWAREPVWTQRLEEKSFYLCRGSNLDRPVVQPVARHYTDWATRLTMSIHVLPNS
jgi:hypothetical protein